MIIIPTTIDSLPEPGTPEYDSEVEDDLKQLLDWYIKKKNTWLIRRIEIAPIDTHLPDGLKKNSIELKVWGIKK